MSKTPFASSCTEPSVTVVKDSGVRENFASGSVRDSREGKGRYDLLPEFAIDVIAKHMEAGAVKYGDRNWEKGQANSRFLDSAQRHISCYKRGLRDENHLAAAAWNVMCIIDQQERIKLGVLDSALDDIHSPLAIIEAADESDNCLLSWGAFDHAQEVCDLLEAGYETGDTYCADYECGGEDCHAYLLGIINGMMSGEERADECEAVCDCFDILLPGGEGLKSSPCDGHSGSCEVCGDDGCHELLLAATKSYVG